MEREVVMSKRFLRTLSLSGVVLLGFQEGSEAVQFTFTENYNAQTKAEQPKEVEISVRNTYTNRDVIGNANINIKKIHIVNQPLEINWKDRQDEYLGEVAETSIKLKLYSGKVLTFSMQWDPLPNTFLSIERFKLDGVRLKVVHKENKPLPPDPDYTKKFTYSVKKGVVIPKEYQVKSIYFHVEAQDNNYTAIAEIPKDVDQETNEVKFQITQWCTLTEVTECSKYPEKPWILGMPTVLLNNGDSFYIKTPYENGDRVRLDAHFERTGLRTVEEEKYN